MAKRLSVKLIEDYLDKYGWDRHESQPEPGEREGIVVTGWRNEAGDTHPLNIDPIVEKKAIVFRVDRVVHAPQDATPADRLSGLLLAMGGLNNRYILGTYGYDLNTGEVTFQLGMPVMKNLAYDEFERCLRTVVTVVDGDGANLKEIVEGTKTATEVLEAEG